MDIKADMAIEVAEALLDAVESSNSKRTPFYVMYNKELSVAYASKDHTTSDEVLHRVIPV